jgi:sugar phosphate isomerase/epimerase
MKRAIILIACALGLIAPPLKADDAPTTRPAIYVDHADLLKLHWQLAAIGSSFADRSTFQMIDLLHSLTVHHIELSPAQIPSPDAVDALAARLKSVHMDVVSIGPVDLTASENDDRKIFSAGKQLKIKTIVANTTDDSLDLLDRLANEYSINVAILNVSKPAAALLGDISGHSSRLGICADVAGWQQAGYLPFHRAQVLHGHILEVRFADLPDQPGSDLLAQLKADGFQGICAVGCKTSQGVDPTPDFIRNVNAFSNLVGDLSGSK